MVSDQDRRELYEALERGLGGGPAATMMELLPPVGWADVARQSDVVALRGEMSQLRGEMGELRGELKGEIAELRGEMGELRGELKGELAEVRGELSKLSARIDGQIPRFIWANVPVVASLAGLVLAVAKFT
jgi:hypothetical protein